jgi:hypothetical protein
VGGERPVPLQAELASTAEAGRTTVGLPVSRTRRTIALSAGGVILVAASLGAAMVYRRDSNKAVVRDSSVTQPTTTPSVTGPQDSARTAQRTDTTTVPRNVEPRLADVGKTLDSLEQIVEGKLSPSGAARVIRTVEEMSPRIKGNEQVVQAAIVKAIALSTRGDNKAACAALGGVRDIARKTSRAHQFAYTDSSSC